LGIEAAFIFLAAGGIPPPFKEDQMFEGTG
jgi:hypothetical protein